MSAVVTRSMKRKMQPEVTDTLVQSKENKQKSQKTSSGKAKSVSKENLKEDVKEKPKEERKWTKEEPLEAEQDVKAPFEGWSVILVGSMGSTLRKNVEDAIRIGGGNVSSSMNKSTTHCCYSGVDGVTMYGQKVGKGTAKYKMAKKKRLPFLSPQDILEKVPVLSTTSAFRPVLGTEIRGLASFQALPPTISLYGGAALAAAYPNESLRGLHLLFQVDLSCVPTGMQDMISSSGLLQVFIRVPQWGMDVPFRSESIGYLRVIPASDFPQLSLVKTGRWGWWCGSAWFGESRSEEFEPRSHLIDTWESIPEEAQTEQMCDGNELPVGFFYGKDGFLVTAFGFPSDSWMRARFEKIRVPLDGKFNSYDFSHFLSNSKPKGIKVHLQGDLLG